MNSTSDTSIEPKVTEESAETTGTEEKIKITFMGWGTDAEIATFKEMLAQYETKYPDVEVNIS